MSRTVPIDQLAAAINEGLEEYADLRIAPKRAETALGCNLVKSASNT